MVGWIMEGKEGLWRVKTELAAPLGLPLLRVALPPGPSLRRVRRGMRRLCRQGVRRVLVDPALWDGEAEALLKHYGLQPVDPLPLCRAQGARLALFLLEDTPAPRRRVALRGSVADAAVRAAAFQLCPRAGTLLLDFERGEEELGRALWLRYGAAPLHLGAGAPPGVSVEFSPAESLEVPTLRLWGVPELGGLTLAPEETLPGGLPRLPFLQLLWETGRRRLEDMAVGPEANVLDRRGQNTYNKGATFK